MFDAELAALFGKLSVEELGQAVELFSQLQADLNEAHLRQNFAFVDNEK